MSSTQNYIKVYSNKFKEERTDIKVDSNKFKQEITDVDSNKQKSNQEKTCKQNGTATSLSPCHQPQQWNLAHTASSPDTDFSNAPSPYSHTIRRQAPSLVDLCVQLAVANVRYLGNVGLTDDCFLDRILPHCTLDQLTHIEDSTEGRDLSPVTDKLWKNFFKREFGKVSFDEVVDKLEGKKVNCTWRELYEAKLKVIEEKEARVAEQIKERYKNVAADKQKRQIQVCMKVPPSSSKRSFFGGPYNGVSSTKSNIMKKAKLEFINSREVKNLAAAKKNSVQRNHSIPLGRKPSSLSNGAASSRPNITPPKRKY